MNPSHDNTTDETDLEIARLKAELEELAGDYTLLKIAVDHVSGALCDSGEVVPEDCRSYGEAVRVIVADRLRTATQNVRLREALEPIRLRSMAGTPDLFAPDGHSWDSYWELVERALSSGDSE